MQLEEILDTAELGRLIAENYITARDHPALPYKILNYTPKYRPPEIAERLTEAMAGGLS